MPASAAFQVFSWSQEPYSSITSQGVNLWLESRAEIANVSFRAQPGIMMDSATAPDRPSRAAAAAECVDSEFVTCFTPKALLSIEEA